MNLETIKSYPLAIRFAGWESDTYTLQRQGWQLAARQGMSQYGPDYEVQFILRHEQAKLHAITAPLNFRMMEMVRGGSEEYLRALQLNVVCMGSEVRVQVLHQSSSFRLQDFSAVDCTPQMSNEEVNLSELKIFRPISTSAPEIIIPTASVDEMMELVLKLQDPKQAEIRDRFRKEQMRSAEAGKGYDVHRDIKCQILAFG